MIHYDPLNNPYGFIPEIPDMDKLTEEEQQEVRAKVLLLGCGVPALAFVLVMLLALLFGSCTTTRYVPAIENKTYDVRQRLGDVDYQETIKNETNL